MMAITTTTTIRAGGGRLSCDIAHHAMARMSSRISRETIMQDQRTWT